MDVGVDVGKQKGRDLAVFIDPQLRSGERHLGRARPRPRDLNRGLSLMHRGI